MTDEKLAELHATAAERADSLMDKPTIAGSQPYVTEPKPYHADALTPANHVPGNVILPSAEDLDAVATEQKAEEQSNG